jgi:lipoprotein-releasing system permease protein
MVLAYGADDYREWRGVRERVLSVPGIAGATPFLYNEVMLSARDNLTGAILKGIDPETIGTVSELPRAIEEGRLEWIRDSAAIPAPGRSGEEGGAGAGAGRALPGIVVGRELARALRHGVGDEVNVVSPFGDLGPPGRSPRAVRSGWPRSSTAACTSTTRSGRTSISLPASASSARATPSPASSSRWTTWTPRAR